MSDPTGSTSYSYERRGLLKTEARTILGTLYNLAYGYDYNGNRNSLTYPDSSMVSYGFDWADRPISAAGGSNTYVSSASYEPFGPIAKLVFGNGSTQTFSYDQRYRPSEDKLVNGSTTIADYLYQEDAVGNITQINDNTNSGYNRSFGYDDLNRLTTANSGASLWGTATGNGYTYDLMGNMKTLQLGSGRTASFAYSGTTPKLTSVTENGTPRSVSYDAAGNETTVGSANYTYTPRNLLSSGDGLSYVSDGWARRTVSTISSGSRYSFAGPDMTLLSETNVSTGSPTIAYDYLWFGGRPIAQSDSTGVHYTVADHLGTPLLQTDSSSNVYWRAEEEPYGKVWSLRANDVHQPLRLPGQVAEQFDNGANGATERSYNVFRWYRAGWARYSQLDPLPFAGGARPYGYSNQMPINTDDPFGLTTYIGQHWVTLFSALGTQVYAPFAARHVFIVLDPFDILKKHPDYRGRCVQTLSGELIGNGFPGAGSLDFEPNVDVNEPWLNLTPIDASPLGGDAVLDSALRETVRNYPNGVLPYAGVPAADVFFWAFQNGGPAYNSGGFIAGLLNSVNLNGYRIVTSLPNWQPGAELAVPTGYFSNRLRGSMMLPKLPAGPCGCPIVR
ncbi:MAG: RHS repeat protein [Candidatus Eremiobacteraeota bacterium]|nr:RHS repeat protein [Candidatus Eremiobacteraeota bacterium]